MKQTLRIQFDEQSKGVCANVDLTVEGDEKMDNDQILAEARRLFEAAQAYAHTKTLQKNR